MNRIARKDSQQSSDSLDAYPNTAGGGKTGEWIDVRDKLPEDTRAVIVAIRNADCPVEGWWCGPELGWCIIGWGLDDNVDVTHWMPLPPLPKMPSDSYRKADCTWYKIIVPCEEPEEPIEEELTDG